MERDCPFKHGRGYSACVSGCAMNMSGTCAIVKIAQALEAIPVEAEELKSSLAAIELNGTVISLSSITTFSWSNDVLFVYHSQGLCDRCSDKDKSLYNKLLKEYELYESNS